MRKESLYQWNRDKLRKIPIIGALLARDRVKAKQVSRFFFDVLCLFMAGSMISCAVHPLTSIKQLHPTSHKTTYINRDIFDYRPTEEYPRTIRSEDAELPLSHREFPSKLSSYHALSLNKLLLYPIEFPSQTRILMDGNPNIPDNLLKGAGGGSMVGFVAFLVAVLSIGECTERADEDGDGFKECTNYRDPTDKEKQILLYSFLIPAVGGTILGASWDIAEALEARQKRLRLKHPRLRGTLAIQGLLPEDALHAGEKAQLTIRLENSGNKSASDIALDLDFGNYEQYLKIPQIEKIKKLKPGKQQVIQVPIQANTLMPTGTVRITLAGRDKNGHLIQGEPLNIQTRERLYPAELVTNVTFSDETAFIPNRSLDATERGQLTVTVRNNGEGMGFDVKLKVNSDNPDVTVEEAKSLGNLAPNEEKTVTIPLQTSLQAKDGFANILVETKEKRGFDAQKQQIRIPVVHLSAPKLEIASIELNDRMLGRAQGNGIPENDETIELIAFIKNNGVGDAIAAKLELVEINSGLSMLERAMDLGIIRPNQTVKGTLLFHVPRLFSAEQLKYQLRVSEIRGVGTAEKTETIAMSARQPILAYSIRPPDVLHNGEQVAFELIPKNQGLLDARGVSVRLSASGASITPETFELGDIQAGTTGIERRVVVDLPRTYSQKQLTLQIQMTQSGFAEKSGTETYPVELLAPEFIVTDRFVDQNGNQVIEQGERVEVELTVTNRGRLEAQNVRLSVDTSVPDVRIAESQRLVGTLPPNTTSDSVKFIFTLPRTGRVAVVPDYGDFPITVTINQSEFQSVTHRLNYTIAPASPILGVTAQFVDEDKDGRIEQGEQVDVAVTVTNTGKQDALNAEVELSTAIPNVVIAKKNQSIGTLSPNKSESVTFAVTIPRGVPAGAFPLEVKVTHAEFAPVVKPLNYTIHEAG
ncbi:hypothetical protein H8E77_33540, partial [bacterium]|nr:hypothetical protein [bacterium]